LSNTDDAIGLLGAAAKYEMDELKVEWVDLWFTIISKLL
jgi:hypothetical protein